VPNVINVEPLSAHTINTAREGREPHLEDIIPSSFLPTSCVLFKYVCSLVSTNQQIKISIKKIEKETVIYPCIQQHIPVQKQICKAAGVTDTFTYIYRLFSRQTVDKIHKHRKIQQYTNKIVLSIYKKQHY